MYQDVSADAVRGAGVNLEERREQLFAKHVDVMFRPVGRAKRQGKAVGYTDHQTVAWLTWLADAMKRHSQTVLYLGSIQPDWLTSESDKRLFRVSVALLCGLTFGLTFVMYGPIFGLTFGLLMLGLFGG